MTLSESAEQGGSTGAFLQAEMGNGDVMGAHPSSLRINGMAGDMYE